MSFHSVSEEQLQKQLDNEEMVIDKGVAQYRLTLMKARNGGTMSDTMPGRWLSANFLEEVSMRIRREIAKGMRGESGQGFRGVRMLTQLEPDV